MRPASGHFSLGSSSSSWLLDALGKQDEPMLEAPIEPTTHIQSQKFFNALSISQEDRDEEGYDYDLDMMASTALNRQAEDSVPAALDETHKNAFFNFSLSELANFTDDAEVGCDLSGTADNPSSDEEIRLNQIYPKAARRSRVMPHIFATKIQSRLQRCHQTLDSTSITAKDLEMVNAELDSARELLSTIHVQSWKASTGVVKECQELLQALKEKMKEQKSKTAGMENKKLPVQVDNSHAFVDFTRGHQTPTLIAYTMVLALRVFDGLAERGASYMLKMLKLFGFSMVLLGRGGETSVAQRQALKDIPESISTLEKRLNLGMESIPYAVCKKCCAIYPPVCSTTSPLIYSISNCTNLPTPDSLPCGTPLLENRKPLKTFHYFSFHDWFGRFIALPGIEDHGDAFCEDVEEQPDAPDDKSKPSDGSFIRHFCGPDGRPFIRDRGSEGRWFFKLYADSFNVEGNRIRGKARSTGVFALTCLNLPPKMANDPAYMYVAGLVEGPSEPSAQDAAHSHFLQPLAEELEVAYSRGLTPYRTHSSYQAGDSVPPYHRVFRIALVKAIMDLKAARPWAGLMDVSAHMYCFMCQVWHQHHVGRTDCSNWGQVNDSHLREGAMRWKSANKRERRLIEQYYGTRWSALWILSYWRPSLQLVVDPMHTIYLLLIQNFFRFALGLQLKEGQDLPGHEEIEEESHSKASARANEMSGAREEPGYSREKYAVNDDTVVNQAGRDNDDSEDPDDADDADDFDEDEDKTVRGAAGLAKDADIQWGLDSKLAYYYDFSPPPHPSSIPPIGSTTERKISGRLGDYLNIEESPDDDERLLIVEWPNITEDDGFRRQSRKDLLLDDITSSPGAFQSLYNIHQHLSAAMPRDDAEEIKLLNRLKLQHWVALFYVCHDLRVFPEDFKDQLLDTTEIKMKGMRKHHMAAALLIWRLNEIKERDRFEWPFFTPVVGEPPVITWKTRYQDTSQRQPSTWREIPSSLKQELLKELNDRMNYNSAVAVGQIHRILTKPMDDTQEDKERLKGRLNGKNQDALAWICIDIGRLPLSGQYSKFDLIRMLVNWRMEQPLSAMKRVYIDAVPILSRIQSSITDIITPSWVSSIPKNVGSRRAGVLKADQWRTLYSIYVPLVLLGMWSKESPIRVVTSSEMAETLDTSMMLTCAVLNMTKNTLTLEGRNTFLRCIEGHVEGLKKCFPGFLRASHHLAFHIYDLMESFSAVRFWWAFPFERFIGKLQRIPTNHKAGQQEQTILHSFYRGSLFRQWILRPDCPPLIKYCNELLNRAYNHDTPTFDSFSDDLDDEDSSGEDEDDFIPYHDHRQRPVPRELLDLVGENVTCIPRVKASDKGHYRSAKGGNSYICFKTGGSEEWLAGQIRHIYRQKGQTYMAIRRSKTVNLTCDPFRSYWSDGFEAKIVSSAFLSDLEIVPMQNVMGHTARWILTPKLAVVLNLSRD